MAPPLKTGLGLYPIKARFPEKVQLATASALLVFRNQMAPPPPLWVVLLKKLLLLILDDPLSLEVKKMAPPPLHEIAVLPENVLLVTVSVSTAKIALPP